jgi:hypothetical protein
MTTIPGSEMASTQTNPLPTKPKRKRNPVKLLTASEIEAFRKLLALATEWTPSTQWDRRVLATLDALQADTDRLTWLEKFITKDGPVVLHDGLKVLRDVPWVGLAFRRDWRTLREAIDSARGAK